MTYTVGGLYFKESGFNGSPDGLTSGGTIFMFPLANNVLPSGRDITYFDGKSSAAFGQVEFHASETLDLVAGARYTDDNKSGQYYRAIPAFGVPLSVSPYKFDGTKTTYLLGANYHLSDDVLLYGKYSTGYISGGSIAGVPFTPETAKSYEVGLKSEFLDRRVRLNVAAFQADYGALRAERARFAARAPRLEPGARQHRRCARQGPGGRTQRRSRRRPDAGGRRDLHRLQVPEIHDSLDRHDCGIRRNA